MVFRIKLNESSEFQIKEAKECLRNKIGRKALKKESGEQKKGGESPENKLPWFFVFSAQPNSRFDRGP